MEYKKNDIVRLNNKYFSEISSKLCYQQNLFRVVEYMESGRFIKLEDVADAVPASEVCPVRIDGVEDRNVYYDPIIAASIVPDGKDLPSYHVDEEEYYIEQLKKSLDSDGRTYYEVLQEKELIYVHQIQQELPEIGDDLRIHYTVKVN